MNSMEDESKRKYKGLLEIDNVILDVNEKASGAIYCLRMMELL